MKKRMLSILMSAAMLTTLGTGALTAQAAGDKVNVELWNVWTGNAGDCLQQIADDFNVSQDQYEVTVTYSGTYEDTFAKYQAASAGNRPDMVMVSTEYVAFFVDNPEYFVPVSKYVQEDNYDTSDIMANLRASYSDTQGNLYCAPIGNTVVGFFYNTKVCEAAGIDPSELNSYEEIAKACAALKANGVKNPIYIPPNSIYYTFPLSAEGVQYVDNNNGKDALCTRSLIGEEPLNGLTNNFFQFMQDRANNGELLNMDLAGTDVYQNFIDGNTAILFATCSGLNTIGNQANWELEFGFHPAVTLTEGAENHGQATGGGTIFLGNNNDPEAERASWEFMKYLMQPENTAAFAMATGYLPTTEDGFQTEEYQAFVEKYFPTAVDAYEAQKATEATCYNAYLPMFADFHQIVIDYMKKIVTDSSYTPEQATMDLAEEVDECIELYALSK